MRLALRGCLLPRLVIQKRTLINECKKNRLPAVVKVPVAMLLATGTGKNRDQGSIFSHEIRFCEAAGVPYYLQGSHINII